MLAKLSSLLLTNIDGIMIGNYVGSDALSAVNIFYPTELIIGSVVTMLCAGVSNYIPVIIGRNEPDRLNAAYCAISIIKKIFAAVITLLQIPLIYLQILKEGGSKMKKRRRSAVSIIMALGLVLSLSGCAPSVDVSVKPKEASREPIELTWWVYSSGAAPIDTELVQEAANKYSAEKIGVTVNMVFKEDEQFDLSMTAGDNYDMTFTSDWCNSYAANAYKGMFYDITELVQKETPALYEAIDDDYWNVAANINGRYYAVPVDGTKGMMMYLRLDQERYEAIGMELKDKMDFADLEPYLEAYSKNYSDVVPLPLGKNGLTGLTNFCQWIAGCYLCSPYYFKGTDRENKIVPFWENEVLMDRYRLLNKWYKLGYINPDAAITESIGKDVRASVRAGSAWPGYKGWSSWAGYPIFMSLYDGPYISTASTRGALFGINAADSEERAIACLKYLELLRTDHKFRDILRFGIEGTHFNYLDDGTVLRTEQGKANWSMDAFVTGSGVSCSVESVSETDRSDPDPWPEINEAYKEATYGTLGDYSFDMTSVEAENAACNAVMDKYFSLLITGTENVDEILPKIKEELEAAGYETVLEEAQRQLDEYLSKKGA